MSVKIRVRHALPLWERLRRRWRSLRGAGLNKTHVVHRVTIGEARLKRVRFADSERAGAAADALERLADSGCVPRLLMHQEAQLWVEYVPGRLANLADPADRERLLECFVRLYCAAPSTAMDPSRYTARLQRDLEFLNASGVLQPERVDQLQALELRLRPSQVLVGYDYIDPLGKNFVIQGDRAVAIDIEALTADSLLGTGLAKAALRWPFDPSAAVLAGLTAASGPMLQNQLSWVRLCFLGDYFKQKLLQGKPGHIQVAAFSMIPPEA